MKKVILSLSLPTIMLLANDTTNPFTDNLDAQLVAEQQWLEEETFVTSASRVKENIKKSASSISVIDSEMIKKMGVNNILEVLSTVSGIGINQSNIYVKEVEVRGIKDWFSKKVLFMLDGHSLDANLLNGGATWALGGMNLDNIERIEIIKGPASALYGANAFTALVNIITKNAQDIDGTIIKTKVGSNNTKEVNFLYGKVFDELSIVTNINIFDTDGDSVFVNKDASGNSGISNPYGKSVKADLKVNYKDFHFNAMISDRNDGPYFGATGNMNKKTDANNDYYFAEFGYQKSINDKLDISTRFYFDKFKFYNTWHLPEYSLVTVNGLSNTKKGLEGLATYKVNNNFTTIFGAMYESHKQYEPITINNGISVPNPNGFMINFDREMWAGYINNLYDISDAIRLTIGARYDNYSDFGSNFAPRGGISWAMNDNHTLKVMYGEGFTTPVFGNYYTSSPVIQGNPDVVPEKVSTYEASLDSTITKDLKTKVTLFNNDFKDLIQESGGTYKNIGKLNTKGLEVEAKYDLHRGSYLLTNYTYQKAVDEVTNEKLPNIAQHKANIMLNYRVNNNISLFNHLFIKGSTERTSTDTRESVDGHAIFNTAVNIKNFYKDLEMKISVNNIF
jgi:iron complex outermembrane receptor protein